MRIIKKAGYLILVLVCVSFLSFLLANISAIDPAEAYARRVVRSANKELIAQYRELTGFDKTILQQYLSWLHKAVRQERQAEERARAAAAKEPPADLARAGLSAAQAEELGKALPVTLLIAACASAFSIIAAVPLGIAAALYKNRLADKLIGFISFLSFSVPGYCTGLLVLLVFGMRLHLFPVIGHGQGVSVLFASFTLALPITGTLIRFLRSFLLENEEKEYVQYAKARGITDRDIMTHHLLRNAVPVLVTLWGQNIGYLIAGTAIVETIFSIPGIGMYALNAAVNRDFPVINAYLIVTAFTFTVCNGAAEFIGEALNPS